MLPLRPGSPARHTHDYRRHGVLDLYAALEVATGKLVHRVSDGHTGRDFLNFLKQIAREYPTVDLHVIVDNSSTHTTPEVMAWLSANRRVTMHFTPTSASWLNQVEGVFSILTRRSLRQTSFASRTALRKHLTAFMNAWNRDPTPFVWTKSPHAIVRDYRRMLARISRTPH
jgi:transposase